MREHLFDIPPFVQQAIAIPEAQNKRQETADLAVRGLEVVSTVLKSQNILFEPNDKGVAAALMVDIGAQLARSIYSLLCLNQSYGAAALLRQLVEIEYISYGFRYDDEVVDAWMSTSEDDIRKFFSPKAMRTRFTDTFSEHEYSNHCAEGGHPRPRGVRFLKDPEIDDSDHNVLWADFCLHLEHIWDDIEVLIDRYNASTILPASVRAPVKKSFNELRDHVEFHLRQRSNEISDAEDLGSGNDGADHSNS